MSNRKGKLEEDVDFDQEASSRAPIILILPFIKASDRRGSVV